MPDKSILKVSFCYVKGGEGTEYLLSRCCSEDAGRLSGTQAQTGNWTSPITGYNPAIDRLPGCDNAQLRKCRHHANLVFLVFCINNALFHTSDTTQRPLV